ncbi:MAG: MarR family transcriptional regulator [Bdellovibrionales bacterium]|nr:MarR family transcriptional regulator [Bdellovibrionales bacterium]
MEKSVGLSTAQIFVLQKLAERKKPLSVNELAELTMTHQSSVSVVISKLVQRRLVDRIVSETDNRSIGVMISKQGEYLLSKSPPSVQELLVKALDQLTKRERDGLVTGFQALLQKAGLEAEDAPMLMEDDDGSS